MEHASTLLRESGIAGPLGPALSTYFDTLERPGALAHRRAWARLEAAHEAHHDALGALADMPVRAEAVPELTDRLRSARRTFAALARAEAPDRRALYTRPPRAERRRRARRYAVAAMYLDDALDDALLEV
jgi:hypothetical protein